MARKVGNWRFKEELPVDGPTAAFRQRRWLYECTLCGEQTVKYAGNVDLLVNGPIAQKHDFTGKHCEEITGASKAVKSDENGGCLLS